MFDTSISPHTQLTQRSETFDSIRQTAEIAGDIDLTDPATQMSGMTAQRERLMPSRSDCQFVGVKTPLLSRFDMDKQAACAAACDAKTIIKIQPVHISLAAAADWQWYPVRTATGSGGRRTQVGTQSATLIQLSNTPSSAATMLAGTTKST